MARGCLSLTVLMAAMFLGALRFAAQHGWRRDAAGAKRGVTQSCFSQVVSATHVLSDLDGTALDCHRLSAALRSEVRSLDVVPGTERRWPQSHSAKLRLELADGGSERFVFLKKVTARSLPAKTLQDLERDLVGNRVEARFYLEFAPVLAQRGLQVPRPVIIDERLEVLDALDGRTSEEKEGLLRAGGVLFVLESAEGYRQSSPLNFAEARSSLEALARLHAIAWEDRALLKSAEGRLHPLGGYWTLGQRGEVEMRQMRTNWARYLQEFGPHAPELLSRPGVIGLASRLERAAPLVARQLSVRSGDSFATLIHGDYKAMNIFLPGDQGVDDMALLIDFQWTGLGLGMADVAMHLSHSVAASTLRHGGEERLVEFYRESLVSQLQPGAAAKYSPEVAWKHYRLGVLDWARMVLSVFFKGASPELFESRADNPNVGFVYRDVQASLDFVERVDKYLGEIEREHPELAPEVAESRDAQE